MNDSIFSERIEYRPISVADTDMLLKWRNSKNVVNNFIYRKEVTRSDHLNWLNNKVMTGEVIQFILVERITRRAFGSVYLRDINSCEKSAEYGIFIGEEDMLGKGYGSETAKRIVDYFFNEMGYKYLKLRVLKKNEAAIKSYINAGFVADYNSEEEIDIEGIKYDLIFMYINKP